MVDCRRRFPAKAGIQFFCLCRWAPAFAGEHRVLPDTGQTSGEPISSAAMR
jgi:hypothetical protein